MDSSLLGVQRGFTETQKVWIGSAFFSDSPFLGKRFSQVEERTLGAMLLVLLLVGHLNEMDSAAKWHWGRNRMIELERKARFNGDADKYSLIVE